MCSNFSFGELHYVRFKHNEWVTQQTALTAAILWAGTNVSIKGWTNVHCTACLQEIQRKEHKRDKNESNEEIEDKQGFVCVCTLLGYNERPDLGVRDGQGVHPDAPAAPLIFDSVVEQDAEDGVHHLCDFLLLAVSWVDEAQREHPLLPNGALQQAPTHTHRCRSLLC